MTPPTRSRRPIRLALLAGLAAGTLGSAALPAAAATQSYSYRVELATTAKKARVRAGNVDWECRGRYCIASARGGNVSVRGCQELASQVGRVTSYRSEIKHLSGEQLDACNDAIAAESASPERAHTASSGSPAAAKSPEPPSHVTTDELTFTGVHKWSPAR